jgi:CRISPR system Cascade subunit CasA
MTAIPHDPGLRFQLLDEALIRWRRHPDGALQHSSLPELFAAMVRDEVRDFPALRVHQRHPWHAFLCQLAAIVLHAAERNTLYESAGEWRAALLSLTPEHPDGAAWCLVTPPDRPALLQAPVPGGSLAGWQAPMRTPDSLDMLLTSKNHDLKAERAWGGTSDDWLFALLSLQTQEGFLGAGNYGISRMNGGFASRPGVGAQPVGRWGLVWQRDTLVLLGAREHTAEQHSFDGDTGHGLLWLLPWDGTASLDPTRLAPHYIEVCRRVRLTADDQGGLSARSTGTKAPRIAAKAMNGVTGDAWTPVDVAAGKALTITGEGFHYKLAAELLSGDKYRPAPAQQISSGSVAQPWVWVARGLARGQGKTEGFHHRRVPLSPRVRSLLASNQQALLTSIARERIDAIGSVRKLLWQALLMLFNNGSTGQDASDPVKDKAGRFSKTFEREEDARFFADLTAEIEADHAPTVRLDWLIGMVERAEAHLLLAFDAGPRSAMRRYRARSTALSRFRGGLRGAKSPLPALAEHYRLQSQTTMEDAA